MADYTAEDLVYLAQRGQLNGELPGKDRDLMRRIGSGEIRHLHQIDHDVALAYAHLKSFGIVRVVDDGLSDSMIGLTGVGDKLYKILNNVGGCGSSF